MHQQWEAFMYAMICTKPDIAQAVGLVNWFMADPGQEHWNVVKRILRYIKGTSGAALYFGGSEFIIRGCVDSDLQVILIRGNLLQAMCSRLQAEL